MPGRSRREYPAVTTTLGRNSTAAPYRRFSWQEAIVDYLPPHRQTTRAYTWVERLPTIGILLLTSLLSLRLRNSAFIDEALYINAGQDYLNSLLHGAAVPDHGAYFSGVPVLYPVLAAGLDAVGGLYLVRLFSLVCVLITIILVQDFTHVLFRSRRSGLLAAAAFSFTGSVIFVGALGTFDALCILLLALALWLGVKKSGLRSAVSIGLVLSLAVSVKYTGAIFVPVVVGLLLLSAVGAWRRAAVASGIFVMIIAVGLSLFGGTLLPGIEFTTSTRAALSPTSRTQLLIYLVLNIGLLIALALHGARRTARGGRVVAGSVALLLLGAVALPAAQVRLGEAVSFDKHTAYAALFLAPLAGLGLASMSRGILKLAPVGLTLLLALIAGVSRSGALYAGWVPLEPVLSTMGRTPPAGLYLSSAADSLKYYSRKPNPNVRWQTTFALYSAGSDQIQRAVNTNRFQMIIFRSGATGSSQQDSGQRVLAQAVNDNPRYQLVREPFAVQSYSADRWFVYRLTATVPSSGYGSDSKATATTGTRP